MDITLAAVVALHRDHLPTAARLALLGLTSEQSPDREVIRDLLRTPGVIAVEEVMHRIPNLTLTDAVEAWETLPDGGSIEIDGPSGERRVAIYLECRDDTPATDGDDCLVLRDDGFDGVEARAMHGSRWAWPSVATLRDHLRSLGERWLERMEYTQTITVTLTSTDWDEEWLAASQLGEVTDITPLSIEFDRQVIPLAGVAALTADAVINRLVALGFRRGQIGSVEVD